MGHSAGAPQLDSATAARGPSQDERRARRELIGLVALLLLTLAASLLKGQEIFVFAYIMIVIYALRRPLRLGRPWTDLGVKPGVLRDLKRVWWLAALEAVVLQIAPPILGIAFLFGYGRELVHHITARLPIDIGSGSGLAAIAGLLALALVLTLVEEVVYRVTIQERLSWFIGTPAAILVTAVIFGLAHAVGTTGSPQVVLGDIAGVVLDGVLLGIIYARTHNLALAWATHYAADVVGLVALALLYRPG
jgi:membrane protease YdiL (CAAX protease family)